MLQNVMLLHALQGHILRCVHTECGQNFSGEILLLTGGERTLDKHCLYLGDAAAAARTLAELDEEQSALLLSAGDSEVLRAVPVPEKICLIVVNLSFQGLYNLLHEAIKGHYNWVARMEDVLKDTGGLQAMLEIAAERLSASISVLNMGYRQLAAVYSPTEEDQFAMELQKNGYLAFESVQKLTDMLVFEKSRRSILLLLIHRNGTDAGRVFFSLQCWDDFQYQQALCSLITELAGDYLLGRQGEQLAKNGEFAALASDLIELRLTNLDELNERLKSTRLLVKRYYHVLVLRFSQREEDVQHCQRLPWNYIISQLEQIFPFSNITMYQGEILALVRKSKNIGRLEFDRERMSELLERYQGYAAIGHYSKFLTSLPPIYHQTRSIIDIALSMRDDPAQRIFYYEDFAIYLTVELCALAGQELLGSSNLVYLCTPALISLLRYDAKYNSDYCKVLYTYLRNDRNASATAVKLYIHRNTMLYKLKRMEEIMGETLDDPMVRERLLFSFHVIEYLQRCRHEDILTLKPNIPGKQGSRHKAPPPGGGGA